MVLILAVLAAPGHCLAAAGLRVGIGMATRHPGVWRWRVGPCDRAQEINATTCHTGYRQSLGDGLLLLLHQRSVDFLSGDDGPVRLIGKGGVEGPGGMAGREAIMQLLGLRRQGPIFRARLVFRWLRIAQGVVAHAVRAAHPRGRSRGTCRRVNLMPNG